jgi:osmoprotectant transport system permease protein
MAGIRTAAVWVIGTATLSTPVGQTSLGNYIFTGLQTENWVFVLFGCVAAGGLALMIDRLLALVEESFRDRSRVKFVAALAVIAAIIVASLFPLFGGSGEKPVVIGNKGFDEQYTLSEMMATRLRAAGFETKRRDGLGSIIAFSALASGDIDAYVDYSGTVWSDDMKRTDSPGREAVLKQMAAWLKDKHGIGYLGPIGFENAYAFVMPRAKAEALHIETLADLAAYAPRMKIGGDFEIFTRPEWRAVVKAYGLKFGTQRTFQPNFMYKAVTGGDVDVISAFSSDGRIAEYDLKIITDPKGALPPYDAVLLVSPQRAKDEKFLAALRPLIGAIDLKTMQQANLMVDRQTDKRTPEQTAQWLSSKLKH